MGESIKFASGYFTELFSEVTFEIAIRKIDDDMLSNLVTVVKEANTGDDIISNSELIDEWYSTDILHTNGILHDGAGLSDVETYAKLEDIKGLSQSISREDIRRRWEDIEDDNYNPPVPEKHKKMWKDFINGKENQDVQGFFAKLKKELNPYDNDNIEFELDEMANVTHNIDSNAYMLTINVDSSYMVCELEIESEEDKKVPVVEVNEYLRLNLNDDSKFNEFMDIPPYAIFKTIAAATNNTERVVFDRNDESEWPWFYRYHFLILNGDIIAVFCNTNDEDNLEYAAYPFYAPSQTPAIKNNDEITEEFKEELINKIYSVNNKSSIKKFESSKESKAQNYFKKAMQDYSYQPMLTKKLDSLKKDDDFDYRTLLEIILWKLDRYPNADNFENILNDINEAKNLERENFRNVKNLLEKLISIDGIGLAMASTILRFRNPDVFPIIDRRAYRVAMKEDKLSIYHSTPIEKQIKIYFEYVEKLHELVDSIEDADFKVIDRVLYQFDKEVNGKL